MKKFIFTFIGIAFLASVSAQLKVNTLGEVTVYKDVYLKKGIYFDYSGTNTLGTTTNLPIYFKVNNILAGFTGYTASPNVSFGYGALSGSSGGYNTAIGYNALNKNTGYYNTACGSSALYNNGSSSFNTAVGYNALYSNTSAFYNTATGYNALYANTTGERNTAYGYSALSSNTTGSYNTVIGYNANVSANNLTNATAIGYNATATVSNQVAIGNSSVTDIGGYANWRNFSDGRAKKNIRAEVPGLAFINRLQPVMYNFDLDALDNLLKSDDPKINNFNDSLRAAQTPEEKEFIATSKANKEKIVYTGFIAQDVEKVAKSIGYDFSGVDAPENGKGAYGLRYAEFVVPLVKAVQELSEQVNELKAEIDELKKDNSADVIFKAKTAQQDDVFTQQNKDSAVLYQNNPNPFSQSTEIKYYLPASVKIASLCIYDLNGKQMKQIRLSQRGNGSQIISGSELSAGIYLYALIADGKDVDVKRMILTE